jgi:hypothetical protein
MRDVKILFLAFRTCPAVVTWFGASSLLILLLQVLWLDTIPGAFPQASQIGTVVEGLLAANIAAYIFFMISYQLPQVIEKADVAQTIAQLSERVANRVTGFLQMIKGSTGGGLLDPESVARSDVEDLFRLVSPSKHAPMLRSAFGPPLSWAAAMALHDEQCNEYIDRIWRFARFLDSELIAMLNEIENSPHAAGMKDVRELMIRSESTVTNPDLSVWAANYWACYETARRLAKYTATYRATFVPSWLSDRSRGVAG